MNNIVNSYKNIEAVVERYPFIKDLVKNSNNVAFLSKDKIVDVELQKPPVFKHMASDKLSEKLITKDKNLSEINLEDKNKPSKRKPF